ncbi:GntR family transcriptional regulator [Teredinibacter waterburyi]|jgi:transcriptional regulator, GntR family|uniref:GntR family transcriptional regulator n=1 Tax=Teredinibacter waterburyi TaxID=1500538 RepID=UPI00165F15E5|nr:GntR family transcriptional regulator [Teredinibacter waterburyi]
MSEIQPELEGSLSRVEQAYRKLRASILSNEFPPGFQALEPEIAKKLGVSRTPVREALIRLEAEQLIELIPRRGMRVLPLVPGDMLEINQVLTGLECMAVELLCNQKPSSDMLIPMADAVKEMAAALECDNLDTWAVAEDKFHGLLLSLAGNRRLELMVRTVRAQCARARMITLKLRPKPTDTCAAYREVFEHISVWDWQQAKERYYQHCIDTSRVLSEVLQRYQLPHL